MLHLRRSGCIEGLLPRRALAHQIPKSLIDVAASGALGSLRIIEVPNREMPKSVACSSCKECLIERASHVVRTPKALMLELEVDEYRMILISRLAVEHGTCPVGVVLILHR